MKASYHRYVLDFKRPSGTSRGVMNQKETWFLVLRENDKYGIGECGILRGLSYDDRPDFEEKLRWTCQNIQENEDVLFSELAKFPAIKFGLEQAFRSLKSDNPFHLHSSDFLEKEVPIPINGLVWMGNKDFMFQQINQKIEAGFDCIKMKIGAIDFETELELLKYIRTHFSESDIELRVDANGAFHPSEALDKLGRLASYKIHSIEQPIRQGQWEEMAQLCQQTPLPIALDEELIGVVDVTKRVQLLQTIQPQYIILKPSLLGGYADSLEWIKLAEDTKADWWITSALESNIGLNAIAQFTATLNNNLPQGLGTGALYTNNLESPLEVSKGGLYYRQGVNWQENLIETICI